MDHTDELIREGTYGLERVDVAYALIYQNDQVLMVHNRENSTWSLPGGKVEKGETLKQAAIREVKEETGVTVEVADIVSVNEAFFEDRGHHALFFTFKAKIMHGNPTVQDEDEIVRVEWMDFQAANKRMPYLPYDIEDLLSFSSPYTLQDYIQ